MDPFLKATDVIDWQEPEVLARARALGKGLADPTMVARRCFEWVRDEIKHSSDHGLQAVTCSASEVLRDGSGFCTPRVICWRRCARTGFRPDCVIGD